MDDFQQIVQLFADNFDQHITEPSQVFQAVSKELARVQSSLPSLFFSLPSPLVSSSLWDLRVIATLSDLLIKLQSNEVDREENEHRPNRGRLVSLREGLRQVSVLAQQTRSLQRQVLLCDGVASVMFDQASFQSTNLSGALMSRYSDMSSGLYLLVGSLLQTPTGHWLEQVDLNRWTFLSEEHDYDRTSLFLGVSLYMALCGALEARVEAERRDVRAIFTDAITYCKTVATRAQLTRDQWQTVASLWLIDHDVCVSDAVQLLSEVDFSNAFPAAVELRSFQLLRILMQRLEHQVPALNLVQTLPRAVTEPSSTDEARVLVEVYLLNGAWSRAILEVRALCQLPNRASWRSPLLLMCFEWFFQGQIIPDAQSGSTEVDPQSKQPLQLAKLVLTHREESVLYEFLHDKIEKPSDKASSDVAADLLVGLYLLNNRVLDAQNWHHKHARLSQQQNTEAVEVRGSLVNRYKSSLPPSFTCDSPFAVLLGKMTDKMKERSAFERSADEVRAAAAAQQHPPRATSHATRETTDLSMILVETEDQDSSPTPRGGVQPKAAVSSSPFVSAFQKTERGNNRKTSSPFSSPFARRPGNASAVVDGRPSPQQVDAKPQVGVDKNVQNLRKTLATKAPSNLRTPPVGQALRSRRGQRSRYNFPPLPMENTTDVPVGGQAPETPSDAMMGDAPQDQAVASPVVGTRGAATGKSSYKQLKIVH